VKRAVKKIVKRIVLHLVKQHPQLMDQLVDEIVKHRYHVPFSLTHYYRPFPDTLTVKENLSRWYKKGTFDVLQWDLEKQRKFLDRLQVFKAESDNLVSCAQVSKEGYGQGYGEVETRLLHCMVRYLKPRKVMEVGSGVSTYFTLNALHLNDGEGSSHGEMVCVEPYPSSKISELADHQRIKIVSRASAGCGDQSC
jgi:hypothetical protein